MRKGGFCLSAAGVLGIGLVGLCLTVAPTSVARADEIDDAFRAGVSAFDQGDFEEARKQFARVLAARPSDEKARNYRDEAGFRFWIEVLAQKQNNELATIARKILELAERAAIREKQDPEVIKTALEKLESEDFIEQHEWFERIIALHGHYVVPYLVDALGDKKNDEYRVDVIRLLSRLRGDGVLAINEIMDSDNEFMRQNAAVILGNMRDFRGVPYLRRAADLDPDPQVRAEARNALTKFYDPAREAEPQAHFLRLAEAYYNENPLCMVNNYKEWVVWKWKYGEPPAEGDPRPGALPEGGRQVPRYSWNEQIAEELLYDAIELDNDYEDAWILLLNVWFQQWNEVTAALNVAQQKVDEGQLDPAQAQELADAQKALEKAYMLAASRGRDLLFKGLRRALVDGRPLVAVSFIETIRDINVSDDSWPEEGIDLTGYLDPEPQEVALVTGRPREGLTGKPSPTPPVTRPDGTEQQPLGTGDAPKGPQGEPLGSEPDQPGGTEPEQPGGTEPEQPGGTEPEQPGGTEPEQPDAEPRPRRRTSGLFPKGADYARANTGNNARVRFMPPPEEDDPTVTGTEPAVTAVPPPPTATNLPGASLCAALAHPDKRVRYYAAEAFARLQPAKPFANSNLVIQNLADAVSESGARVLMVVERDQNIRNRIVGLLRELGYVCHGVANALEGVNRARAFPAQDLIIISTEMNQEGQAKDLEDVEFIERLREEGDYRTAAIPVMLLTTRRKQDEKQALVDEGRAVGLITGEIDRSILKDRVGSVFESDRARRDEKARADAMAEFAAKALAQIHVKTTVFDVRVAIPALTDALHNRPDAVRIPAMHALGAFKATSALDKLLAVFNNLENTVDVREKAAWAIGEVIKDEPVSDATFKSLLSALSEPERRIWETAGRALGKGALTGAQAYEVQVNQRIE